MQRFDDKTPIQQVYLSVILKNSVIAQGITINLSDSATKVEICQIQGPTQDPDPSEMLIGDPTLNSQPITIGNYTFPPFTILTQMIGSGVLNATYKLSYQMRLSNGEIEECDSSLTVVSSVS